MHSLPPLYPPFRYGLVEDDLYRGGYPKPRNFRFLTRLRLRSILSLTPEPANPDLAAFCADQKITPLHVRVDKPKEHIPLTFQKTAQILAILIDPNNYPLFVHCLDGAGVTSALIMCLRKLQCWTMSSIMSESSRYNKEGTIGSEEGEFVEKFSAEVELPVRLPTWLWGGQMSFKKHPSIRLKLPAQVNSPARPATTPSGGPANSGDPNVHSATGADANSALGGPYDPLIIGQPCGGAVVAGGGTASDSLIGGASEHNSQRRPGDTSQVPLVDSLSPQITPSASGIGLSGMKDASVQFAPTVNTSKSDFRREKEDLRRRAVTENLLGVDVGNRVDDSLLVGRIEEDLLDEDVEDGMSMTLQALALEMSGSFTKNAK